MHPGPAPTERRVPDRPATRLSRRRLLAGSALAAVAASLTSLPRAAPGRAAESADEAYQRAFLLAVAEDRNVRRHLEPGREFLYRPRQLLAADADAKRVQARLREYGHQVEPAGRFAGVTRLAFDREADIPGLVQKLRDRQQWPGQRPPAVQPHHVLVGFGNIMGNPGGPPRPAAALAPPDPARAGEGAGVTVGVCDTGIWRHAGDYHPDWLDGWYLPESDDEDAVYLYDDTLALQGGHGTFVAGVVRQAAPGVRVDPEAALDATGIGDEEMLVAALAGLGHADPKRSAAEIVNLSLGGYTADDLPPLPLVNALAALPKEVVVVAAAGNSGTDRPAWPAALDPVLAVGAVTRDQHGVTPAAYSNYGPWLDVCAIGDRSSTYVKGQLLLPGLPATPFDGFADWAGTSFATGHVSGRLAAMMTAGGLTAQEARLALLAEPRWHPDYGVLVE
ncbi:S8 family serine peptidase [Solwaraspora sp. WMMD1047]|uniref:S8 family serine peptidase n=1 Tax=Solwaraspora sp. WMMD1047 TaxID=3016102 RepID=UPI002416E35C|nr:S8 family serine peptidase [Solwaraspora sp. WMMD1047]MDG4830811.1 S8 family serine peptidase [Solwaraspora sp. WMMD1047]